MVLDVLCVEEDEDEDEDDEEEEKECEEVWRGDEEQGGGGV